MTLCGVHGKSQQMNHNVNPQGSGTRTGHLHWEITHFWKIALSYYWAMAEMKHMDPGHHVTMRHKVPSELELPIGRKLDSDAPGHK